MPIDLSTLHGLMGVTGRPPYVKSAAEQVHTAPGSPVGYADGLSGEYPCHTKEATWMSALKIASAKAEGGEVSEAEVGIRKFAAFWQISDDVRAVMSKVAEHFAEQPIPEDSYTLDVEHGGERIRKYAAYDPDSTIRAAEGFYDNRFRYPLAWRQKVAKALLKKAVEFGAKLPQTPREYLTKAAGLAVASRDGIESGLISRLNRLPPTQKTASVKLAHALGAIADSPDLRYNHDLVRDVLELTDRFDRTLKLAAHYATGDIPLPEEMLEFTPEQLKTAGDIEIGGRITLQNGEEVNLYHLPKSALDAVDPALAAMPTAKLARVLPTLPSPDAAVLCKAAGIRPARRTRRPGLTPPTPPSKGTRPIGDPTPLVRKGGQEMMPPGAVGLPPPGGGAPMPDAGGMMPPAPAPGPGSIPGAPMPGDGTEMMPGPGQVEGPPDLAMTPGQAERPGAAGEGQQAPPEAQQAPPAAPLDAPLGSIDDDPAIVSGASPSAENPSSGAVLTAGAGAADTGLTAPDTGLTTPGTPMGAQAPAAEAMAGTGVHPDATSGIPQPI